MRIASQTNAHPIGRVSARLRASVVDEGDPLRLVLRRDVAAVRRVMCPTTDSRTRKCRRRFPLSVLLPSRRQEQHPIFPVFVSLDGNAFDLYSDRVDRTLAERTGDPAADSDSDWRRLIDERDRHRARDLELLGLEPPAGIAAELRGFTRVARRGGPISERVHRWRGRPGLRRNAPWRDPGAGRFAGGGRATTCECHRGHAPSNRCGHERRCGGSSTGRSAWIWTSQPLNRSFRIGRQFPTRGSHLETVGSIRMPRMR
jgi:hypothetical protein